uniref:Conserved oligomeric Golgi complex subunit 3 n=1 Tax=Arcella intermedia TaxID=1963864 RepID=A0A6B2KYD7_9EUKA
MSEMNKIATATERPLPKGMQLKEEETRARDEILPEDIHSVHHFYQWFSSLEKEEFEENDSLGLYLNKLSIYTETCKSLLDDMALTEAYVLDIEKKFNLVSKKTEELHNSCKGVIMEEQGKKALADGLREKLVFFDELESIAKKLNNPALSVEDQHFLPLLRRLDECVLFLIENPTFKESASYLTKFRQLQTKGLTLIKNFIVNSFKEITNTMISNANESANPTAKNSNFLIPRRVDDISIFYVLLKSQASRIQPLCKEIELRIMKHTKQPPAKAKPEFESTYIGLLTDCQKAYFYDRQRVLLGTVSKELESLSTVHEDLHTLIRSSCLYLMNICEMEYELYHHFFSTTSTGLRMLFEVLSTTLYDNIRPMIIRCQSIDVLCSLFHILKTEIVEREIQKKGSSVAAFAPIITRIMEDIQERLIFRTSLLIRDEIEGFKPTKEDLDYPQKIINAKTQAANNENILIGYMENTETHIADHRYLSWYPTLEKTLACLSKLYLTIDNDAFDGIAQDVIKVCTQSFISAQTLIQASQGAIDGNLFMISHLQTLQEEIAPFDINFTIKETVLDFSAVWTALKVLLSGQKPLFKLSRDNAIWSLITEVKPRIKNTEIDYKKDMEMLLKQTKSAFINDISNMLLKEISGLLTQISAFSSTNKSDPLNEKKLSEFITTVKVKNVIDNSLSHLRAEFPPIIQKLSIYLEESKQQYDLYKPIKSNIIETFSRVNQIIEREYSDQDITLIDLNDIIKFLDSTITNPHFQSI